MSVNKAVNNIKNNNFIIFTKDEINYLTRDIDGIILYQKDGRPYVDYSVAKMVFEEVIGQDYSYTIESEQFYPEFNTFYLRVRFIICRNGAKVVRDVMGAATGSKKSGEDLIHNFKDLGKSAMKDAMRKFYSDYIGIGAKQFIKAKEEYDKGGTPSKKDLKCSSCGREIDEIVYNYSITRFPAKKPLCRGCQSEYRKNGN